MSEYEVSAKEYEAIALGDIKPSYKIKFINPDNEEVGVLDFNGSSLAFEGNVEMSAIIFINWIDKTFVGRLKEEYDRGFAEGRASHSAP